MKKIVLSAALFIASFISFAQVNVTGASNDVPGFMTEIMNAVGLKPNFTLKPANVDNLEASVSKHKRYILYNPEFIGWLNKTTNDKWAAIALLAHEIGHHLNGHTIKKRGSIQLELEADEFAGFVLNKLGASLEQSQRVMNYVAKAQRSKTHPARADRILAIKAGWNNAMASAAANGEIASFTLNN